MFPERGLIVSGDCEGLLKLWNIKKELIREIKFTEPITSVCFLNLAADIVVGHQGKLSRLNASDYLPKMAPITEADILEHRQTKAPIQEKHFLNTKSSEEPVSNKMAKRVDDQGAKSADRPISARMKGYDASAKGAKSMTSKAAKKKNALTAQEQE